MKKITIAVLLFGALFSLTTNLMSEAMLLMLLQVELWTPFRLTQMPPTIQITLLKILEIFTLDIMEAT